MKNTWIERSFNTCYLLLLLLLSFKTEAWLTLFQLVGDLFYFIILLFHLNVYEKSFCLETVTW